MLIPIFPYFAPVSLSLFVYWTVPSVFCSYLMLFPWSQAIRLISGTKRKNCCWPFGEFPRKENLWIFRNGWIKSGKEQRLVSLQRLRTLADDPTVIPRRNRVEKRWWEVGGGEDFCDEMTTSHFTPSTSFLNYAKIFKSSELHRIRDV